MADAFFQHLATECACFPATGGPILNTSKAPNFLSPLSSWFMRLLLLLLTSFSLLAASCTKEDDGPTTPLDELPPATQVGANTFGCLINGEPWYNRGGRFNDPDLSAGYAETIYGLYFNVYARAYDPFISSESDFLRVQFKEPKVGDFLPDDRWLEPLRLTYDNYIFYRLDTLSRVDLTLTRFDLQNQIASGTFSFTVINDVLLDTLVVSEGRFDVEFKR